LILQERIERTSNSSSDLVTSTRVFFFLSIPLSLALTCSHLNRACQLFRILRAYSVYDKDLGYTQGMSDVVGLLLFYNEDEEVQDNSSPLTLPLHTQTFCAGGILDA